MKNRENRFIFQVVVFIAMFLANASIHAQVSVCLGDDVSICQGQTVQITNCGSGSGPAVGGLTLPNPTVISPNLSDDVWSGVVNIGFTFSFYGNNVSQCVIGSNGILSFNTGNAGGFCPWGLNGQGTLPSTANLPATRNAIMPGYSDINPGLGGNIQYQTLGSAPNRRFVVLWREIPAFSCGAAQCNYFGIILYEGTNVIETHVGHKPICSGWNGGLAIQGIQNAAGTVAHITPGRNNSQWLGLNDGRRWTPTAPGNTSNYTMSQIPYVQIIGTGSNLVWANTNGQTFPYNNGVLNVTNHPAGTTGYYLSGTACGMAIGGVSDTTWISISTITASVTATTDFCSSGVGTATVSNPVGNGPFTYQWMPSGQTTQTATSLMAGSHSVTITDAGGCTRNYNVNVPNTPANGTGSSTPVSCSGASDGTATAEMVPPVGTLTYQWNDPAAQTTQTAVGLSEGTYECVITSSSGCVVTVTVTVGVIPQVVSSIASQTDVTCNSGSDGIVVISSSGGTAPYSYSWDNSSSVVNSATDLPAGLQTITITDGNGCVTSITATLNEPPALQVVSISPVQEICPGATTTISANGSGGSSPYTYTWFLNGQEVGVGQTINVTPSAYSNEYCVVLSESCGSPVATACTQVNWPTDIVPTLIADVVEGCFPVEVNFTNLTNSGLIANTFVRFGDGYSANTSGLSGLYHIYETPGVYSVEMEVTTIDGCVYDTVFNSMIVVHDYPIANFAWTPFFTPMFNPQVNFVNMTSADAVVYNWFFEDGNPNVSSDSDPTVMFPVGEVNDYLVTLIVYNEAGCRDSVSKEVSIVSDVLLFAPNAFTPDGDKFNETWRVYIDGIDVMDFDLFIFNRWGEVMWESHDINAEWNGTYGGKIVPEGLYIWTIRATDGVSDKKYEFNGHINVLR